MPGSVPIDPVDPALTELARTLEKIKGGDPLAPVTVVAASGHAAVFVRRALAQAPGPGGLLGWANVTTTTAPVLLRTLAAPLLAARGLGLASPLLDLEVIGAQARRGPAWIGQFASHPAALSELQGTLRELRRCSPDALAAIGGQPGRGRDLVALLRSVRQSLHGFGLADTGDVAAAALEVARQRSASVETLGSLVAWYLEDLDPAESDLLEILGTETVHDRAVETPLCFTEIRPCPDPDEEGRNAVRSVITALESGVPLWRQAIFHPPGPTYARILHQHLAAAGIASSGPEVRRLHQSMTGRSLLGLLDLAAGGWSRHQVMAWLSAGPVTVGPGGGPVPASRWDTISAEAGVVRGPDQWHARLGRLAARDGTEAEEARALAAFVEDLVRRAAPPGAAWKDWSIWATGLLDHYLTPDDDRDRWPESEVAAARQVRQAVATLADLDGVSSGADPPSFRHAVHTQLASVLDSHDLEGGGFGDGVFLSPYGEAHGLRFHTVVVTGLADALVPGRGGNDGLLGDDLRRLDTSGALPTRTQRQERSRRDLAAAVGAGRCLRIGTRPRSDPRSGRVQVPTRWLPELVDADTFERGTDSFAAGLATTGPALSAREFDLRQLDRWVRGGGDPINAPGVDDLRLRSGIEGARGRVDARFTRYDGLIGRGRLSAFDPGTPVSATRFETYAKCPRRYLFDRVLRVSERVRPEDLWRIEPMTRGTLVHAILETYVAERVEGAPRSLDRLLAIAADQLDDAESSGLVGKPLLWRLDRAAIIRDLLRFNIEEGDIEPLAAELSFGSAADGEPTVAVLLDDGRSVAFRGSVDRVDRTASGQLMVTDYKTGKQGQLSDLMRDPVAGGKSLQLPLYAQAAWARFGGPRPVHARYWLLSGERSAPCFHLVVTDEVEKRFRHVVRLIAQGIEDGCFPGVPGPPSFRTFANCRSCDFDAVCPTTRDRQWGRKYNRVELHNVVNLVSGEVPDGLSGAVVKRFVDPDSAVQP